MLVAVTDRKTIEKCVRTLETSLRRGSKKVKDVHVGWQGGGRIVDIAWRTRNEFWVSIDRRHHDRYWVAFGIDEPQSGHNASIVCEINVPISGVNRRLAGAFVVDQKRNVYIAHSGKIGGGKPGVGKQLFLTNLRGANLHEVDWGDGWTSELHVIGRIGSAQLPAQLAQFVREIDRIKSLPTRSESFKLAKTKSDYSPEFAGKSNYEVNGSIERSCNHGLIVDALRNALIDKVDDVGNKGVLDLYTLNRDGSIRTIFEIKTDDSTSSIHAAVGQLMIYGAKLDSEPGKVAVLPASVSDAYRKLLAKIGIDLIVYRLRGVTVKFPVPKQLLNK